MRALAPHIIAYVHILNAIPNSCLCARIFSLGAEGIEGATVPYEGSILFSYLRARLCTTYSTFPGSMNGSDEYVARRKEFRVVRDLVDGKMRAGIGRLLSLHRGQHCVKGHVPLRWFK